MDCLILKVPSAIECIQLEEFSTRKIYPRHLCKEKTIESRTKRNLEIIEILYK